MYFLKRKRLLALLFVGVFASTIALSNLGINLPAMAVMESDWERFLSQRNFIEAVTAIEQHWERDYENYFGANLAEVTKDAGEIAAELSLISNITNTKAAVIWMWPRDTQLELVLITPEQEPIGISVPEASKESLLLTIKQLRGEITNPRKRSTTSYLKPAQQLYEWTIKQVESNLEAENIDTLLLCVGGGLRGLPVAALHDGEKFLIEKYALAIIPAYNLTRTRYQGIKKSEVLAMGASEFQELNPLPAVPVEVSTITNTLWQGQAFLNEDFTVENLLSQRQKQNFEIVHLATHAEFTSGEPSNSYIQFWGEEKLGLDEIRKLNLDRPPVELLVLSACETAVGDLEAELGFAGLAVQAGVKTAVASLWLVSDAGTLALMNEFYRDLRNAPTKAEALREAQVAMLRGQVRLQDGELLASRAAMKLPQELAVLADETLSHPYYWASFITIGSPW